MNATIEIDGLRKRFVAAQALDGMTFTVKPGHVTGFVGPNGAGKSTTMRVVLGLDAPDAGTATIGGRPYRSLKNPLTHVGSLLDAGALQPSRSARNHLPLQPGGPGGPTGGGLSLAARDWLLRITPAAGFSVHQAVPQFPQVTGVFYPPAAGYYPLSTWAGFAVECAWAVAALALAFYLLRRRDA
jgi:energy-coupling factor transporter ATP-binding protein EcfA2